MIFAYIAAGCLVSALMALCIARIMGIGADADEQMADGLPDGDDAYLASMCRRGLERPIRPVNRTVGDQRWKLSPPVHEAKDGE